MYYEERDWRELARLNHAIWVQEERIREREFQAALSGTVYHRTTENSIADERAVLKDLEHKKRMNS
jgi:hypothetical protein